MLSHNEPLTFQLIIIIIIIIIINNIYRAPFAEVTKRWYKTIETVPFILISCLAFTGNKYQTLVFYATLSPSKWCFKLFFMV